MTTRVVTIRNSFAPEVSLQLNMLAKTTADEIKEVLAAWTRITGLNWTGMSNTSEEQPGINDQRNIRVLIVEHPIAGCGKATFFWSVS